MIPTPTEFLICAILATVIVIVQWHGRWLIAAAKKLLEKDED